MTSPMRAGDLCLVTGISGYLGSWLAQRLIEQGFRVRGTVRSLEDSQRIGTLRALLAGAELAAADLRSPAGWKEAVEGCRWVFHVASPQAVPTEKDRTAAAVSGTDYVMRAALASRSVEKIVLTSSEAAIAYGFPPGKQHFTEDDWTDVNGPAGRSDYMRSKTMAESLAWRLAADTAANPRGVPLAVINPSFIAGPSLVPWGRYSLLTITDMAQGRLPFLPDMVNHVVDVRDCADMHIALMRDPAADGHRHFSFAVTARMIEMAQLMSERCAGLGLRPTQRIAPNFLVRMLALFSGDAAAIYSKLGNENHYEPRRPQAYRYLHTDLGEILSDTLDSAQRHGWLKPAASREAKRCASG